LTDFFEEPQKQKNEIYGEVSGHDDSSSLSQPYLNHGPLRGIGWGWNYQYGVSM
jgi:hypothetical protein